MSPQYYLWFVVYVFVFSMLSALNIVSCFVLICICSGISLFCVLCLYICKFSQMFIMVPLCGICFISDTLVMSGYSCPVFIACVAKFP